MRNKLLRIVLLNLLATNLIIAQWSVISYPTNSVISSGNGNHKVKFPTNILPVGDGKILWTLTKELTPSSGIYCHLYVSDDSGDERLLYSYDVQVLHNWGFWNLDAFNDSTIVAYCGLNATPRLLYTKNTYKSVGNLGMGGLYLISICITPNYLYSTTSFKDTLVLRRIKQFENINTVSEVRIPKYYSSIQSVDNKLTFINDSVGFMLAKYKNKLNKMSVAKTIDYGNNWNEIFVDSVEELSSFNFPSKSVGYLAKKKGIIYKTIDGGLTWFKLTILSDSINCIKFTNDTLGYVGGPKGFLAKTVDGGKTWGNELSSTTADIKSLYTFDKAAYFISDSLFKNIAKNKVVSTPFNKEINVFPNPSQGKFTITGEIESETAIDIIDLQGKMIKRIYLKFSNYDNSIDISISDLIDGVYIIKLSQNDTTFIRKIVIINN